MTPSWTGWRPLSAAPRFTPAVLAEILDGGQAFRWHASAEADGTTWTGIWSSSHFRLCLDSSGQLLWSIPQSPANASEAAASENTLRRYLCGHDTPALVDALPWRSDAHLARCIEAFPGLTLLRQPFGETLLAFLCSATKQIVQIRQMLALLAGRHGEPLRGNAVRTLPSWTRLATIPESGLRACQLGFRARYISETARYLAARPGWLEETEALPYPEAKARLMALPGVGEKVADCVLLFGAGRLEAFPVDTWIIKAMTRHYGLHGWAPQQVAHFGRVHFGGAAGLAQQYLFAWERREAGRLPQVAPAAAARTARTNSARASM
ncbi:DNA-binding protein [Opitutaceae bacterium TAV5]|nr:DNA-binding protein [Opitutaceae bacterium TAV5]